MMKTLTFLFACAGALAHDIGIQAAAFNGVSMRGMDAAVSTYIGLEAGQAASSSDTKNTAVGAYALRAACGGEDSCNTAFGFKALFSLTTGKSNVAVGAGTLLSQITGDNNTVLGHHAMLEANGAFSNVVIGYRAADSLTTGSFNVAIGADAMANGAVTGTTNVAIGFLSGYSITEGSGNVLMGYGAANSITTGQNNICIGGVAGHSLTTTSSNVCIGVSAGQSTTGYGSVFIGHEAGKNETGGGKLYIDNSDTSKPLIGGDFSARTVTINGVLWVGSVAIASGSGSPEGVLALPVGSTFHRTDSGGGSNLYVKESGTGNTGWTAK